MYAAGGRGGLWGAGFSELVTISFTFVFRSSLPSWRQLPSWAAGNVRGITWEEMYMRMWHETVRDRGGGDTGVNGEDEKAQHSKRRPHAANTALKVFFWRTREQMMASSSSPSPSRTRAAAHASEQDPCEAVAKLAELILAAEHCVFVTGAGISTNAGIRDYLS